MKQKKIVVIGGLGYLGWTICQQAIRLGHLVVCVDNNLFGKWEDEELDLIQYIHQDVIEFAKKFDGDADRVYICSDIDIQAYKDCAGLDKYREKYEKAIKALRKKSDVLVRFDNTPELFGIGRSFRSDTIINEMVLSMAFNNRYQVNINPFTIIHACNVRDYAHAILSEEANLSECALTLPVVMICNLLQPMFSPDCQLGMVETTMEENLNVNIQCSMIMKEHLALFVKEVMAGKEQGQAWELLEDKYNNEMTVDKIVAGVKYQNVFK